MEGYMSEASSSPARTAGVALLHGRAQLAERDAAVAVEFDGVEGRVEICNADMLGRKTKPRTSWPAEGERSSKN